jgi:hypothetical protein
MRKKLAKKLVLNRETLAELDGFALQGVAGGATVTCQPDNCDYSNGRRTCLTCDLTCTTNNC